VVKGSTGLGVGSTGAAGPAGAGKRGAGGKRPSGMSRGTKRQRERGCQVSAFAYAAMPGH